MLNGNSIDAKNTETITVSKLGQSCSITLPPNPIAKRMIAVDKLDNLLLVTVTVSRDMNKT